MTMSTDRPAKPSHNPERNPDPIPYPKLVFVSHEITTTPGTHNAVIGHGRRLQLEKRNREKQIAAQRGASYARSLVGWQPSTSSQTVQPTDPVRSPTALNLPEEDIDQAERWRRVRDLSPSTLLKRGQSDPFSTLAVEITPEVNEIVSFFRDTMILAFYSTKWQQSKAAVVQMHWNSILQALQDRGSAMGFLGRTGRMFGIATRNERIQLAALRYTTESTAILRARLQNKTHLSATDQWHISMLWGTEILFRNLDAALLHGRMIRRLVEEQVSKGTLNLVAFRYILYYDIHLCTMLMVRSVFDYFVWVPKQYEQLGALATAFMRFPNQEQGEDDGAVGLDPSINSEVLLPIFQQRRRHMKENAWWLERAFEELNLLLQGWLAVNHHICHGQVIVYALDCLDEAANQPPDRGRLLTEASLALAALQVTRAGAGGQLILRGVDVFEARRAILDKMLLALQMVLEIQALDFSLYGNAILWALYVGVRGARTLRHMPEKYTWFTVAFNRLREALGLATWVQTQDVLRGFLHHEPIYELDGGPPSELVE
jgi:hypothetical protein